MGSEGFQGATGKPLGSNTKDKQQFTDKVGCPKGSKGRGSSTRLSPLQTSTTDFLQASPKLALPYYFIIKEGVRLLWMTD